MGERAQEDRLRREEALRSAAPLAITLGDPSGIGAEIVAKALGDFPHDCVIFGERALFAEAWRRWGRGVPPPVREPRALSAADRIPGRPTEAGLLASVAWVVAAHEAVTAGEVAAVVTAPLVKRALKLAGHDAPGHTELLQQLAGVPRVAMMLAGERLRVVLATTHCALREVSSRLEAVDLPALLRLISTELQRKLGIAEPRLALAALNPHGGEGGLFGDEESRLLVPAVELVRGEGLRISGPHPADTLFVRASRGEFDAVVALYHDQALIPLKLLHFGSAVNVTLGLPYVRTSPDHGVAYDLAGGGQADPGSMLAALHLAAEMVTRGGCSDTPLGGG